MQESKYEELKPEKVPDFISRFIHESEPPFRGYIHGSIAEGKSLPAFPGPLIDNAEDYLFEVIKNNLALVKDAKWLIAAVWGLDNEKDAPYKHAMIDLFAYSGIDEWPGNPDVSAYVFKNGVYQPEMREITCGDTLIVLGAEEKHRRKSRSLYEYMHNHPDIEGLVKH